MATEGGKTAGAVTEDESEGPLELALRMQAEPYRFSFFQAMRLLEWMHPGLQPVGTFGQPGEEIVRISARPTLTFPASEIESLELGEPARMEINFLGLNTVNGPMPRANTAMLLERQRRKDHATAEFYDLFNHRVASLFYRAWKRYRFFLGVETAHPAAKEEVFARLYDLVGLGTAGLRGRMNIPDEAAIFYAGLLSRQIRSVDGLTRILREYFAVQVEIRQFTGAWQPLSPDQQTHLREGSSFAERLGHGAVLGDQVWNQEGALTVRLGPMPLEQYQDFLPGGSGQQALQSWLQLYSRRAFSFVVQLVLERDDVPRVEITADSGRRLRLGYETWLKLKPCERHPDETTYVLQ